MSNQSSDFQWCKCGVNAHLPIRKSVEAPGEFRFLCTPAVASDRDLLAIKGLGTSVLQELRQKQRQAVGELRAAMAADTIAGMWEQEPNEDDETS